MKHGHSHSIGQILTVDGGGLAPPSGPVAPTPSITIVGTYAAGQQLSEVVYALDGEGSGVPPLEGGEVSVLVDGAQQGMTYVLAAGEVLTARFSWSHVTGTGSTTGSPVIVGAGVPEVFAVSAWLLATGAPGEASVTVLGLPDDGGSPVIDIQYSIDGAQAISSSGTTGFSASGLAAGERVVALRAVNAVGAGPWSAGKPVSVSGASPVNPSLSLGAQVAGSGGNPDIIPVSYSYSGADVVDLFAATGPAGFAITEAQLIQQTGGEGVEFKARLSYEGGEVDLSDVTDDSVTELALVAVERTNGGTSGIRRVPLTDIDFSPPALLSAQTNETGDAVLLAFDEMLVGAPDLSQWTMPGHSITGISVDTNTVTLSIAPTIAGNQADTISYFGANLTDERGNPLAAFSGRAVTNNVPGGLELAYLANHNQAIDLSGVATQTTPNVFPDAGTFVVAITDIASQATGPATLVLSGANIGASATLVEGGRTGVSDAAVAGIWLVTTTAASDLTIGVTGAGLSLDRQVHVLRLTGATATGHLEGVAGGTQVNSPFGAALGSACAVGDAVIAVTLCRSGTATGITWGGAMAGNELADVRQANASHRSGVAGFIADTATTHTATADYDNNDGSFQWAVSIVALKAA
ncbi:hypothetical protein ACRDNQ_07225 [Palleronia sp. KMU-117]|uniref:hypothetical protein n=1 Tax=Palleronia sp. KMU-117 TaxID=3434108 RepID=UPI003D73D788